MTDSPVAVPVTGKPVVWPIFLACAFNLWSTDDQGWLFLICLLAGYGVHYVVLWRRLWRTFPVWPFLGVIYLVANLGYYPVSLVELVVTLLVGYGVCYLVGGWTPKSTPLALSWGSLMAKVSPKQKMAGTVFGVGFTTYTVYKGFNPTCTPKTISETIVVHPDGTKVFTTTTEYKPVNPTANLLKLPKIFGKKIIVLLVPGWDFLPHAGVALVCYVVTLAVVYHWIRRVVPKFEHPLKQFVPAALVDHSGVVHEFHRYSRVAAGVLAHGVAFVVLGLVMFHQYLLWSPVRQFVANDLFVLALRDSLRLQTDKVYYLWDKASPTVVAQQKQLLIDTFHLYHEGVHLAQGVSPSEDPGEGWGWLIVFLVVGWILLRRRGSTPALTLLIPKVQVSPSSKGYLVFSVGAALAVVWLVHRWSKSGTSFRVYLGSLIFLDSTPAGVVACLERFRWFTLATSVGSTGVLVLNWVVIGSTFVSYQFSELGGTTLAACESSFEVFGADPVAAHFHHRYTELTARVLELEVTLQEYYPNEFVVDYPWWLPLVRVVLLGGGVILVTRWGTRWLARPTWGLPR